jgi:polar amino acid transport system substrate-binding protein
VSQHGPIPKEFDSDESKDRAIMHRISMKVVTIGTASVLVAACGAAGGTSDRSATGGSSGTSATQNAPSGGGGGDTVTIGVSGSLVPYLFQNDGKWVGVNQDLLSYVFESKGGYKLKYQEMSFENLIPSLSSGRVDITTNVYDTDARRAKLDFLDFYSAPFAVFALAKNSKDIHSWSDLCGKTLASIYASTISDVIKSQNQKYCPNNPVKNQQQSGSYADLARQVDNGRVFGAIDDAGIWAYFVKQDPKYALALDSVGQTWKWALAFPKGSPLRAKIQHYLDEYLKSDGPSQSAKQWGINPDGFQGASG